MDSLSVSVDFITKTWQQRFFVKIQVQRGRVNPTHRKWKQHIRDLNFR